MYKTNMLARVAVAVAMMMIVPLAGCRGTDTHHGGHEGHEAHGHDEADHAHHHGHSHEAHHHDDDGDPDEGHEGAGMPGEIVFEPEDARRMGVECGEVGLRPMAAVLKVSGEVAPSGTGTVTVVSPKAGRVSLAAGLTRGSNLGAGAALASVSTRGMSGGDSDLAAKAALEGAGRELKRIEALLADGLVTRREYNEALERYEGARALCPSPASASAAVSAPKAGVVTSIDVADGQWVEAGQTIATLAAPGQLTLRAWVPASHAAFISGIAGATVAVHGAGSVNLDDWGGRVLPPSTAAAASTPGYIPVSITFSNAAPVVPGTGAEVYLRSGTRSQVLAVPAGALVEQMGRKFVFVRLDGHGYEKRPVETGRSDGELVEITRGLAPGETVVTRGAAYVRLAEQASVAPEGHSHNH